MDFLATVLTGLLVGSVYGLFGMALVMIYRANDVLNFAMAMMATFSVYIASSALGAGVPLLLAVAVGLVVAGVIGVVTERGLIRPLGPGSHFPALIVMFALSFVLIGAAGMIWGFQPRRFPEMVGGSVPVLGTRIASQRLLSGTFTAVVVILLTLFFRSRLGIEMQAAAEDPAAARAIGIDTRRTARVAWLMGTAIASSCAFLLAPESVLDTGMMDDVMFRAFAGIFVGGFSMVGAGVGGLIIGILDNIFGIYVTSTFRNTLVFMTVAVTIVLKPGGFFGRTTVSRV